MWVGISFFKLLALLFTQEGKQVYQTVSRFFFINSMFVFQMWILKEIVSLQIYSFCSDFQNTLSQKFDMSD